MIIDLASAARRTLDAQRAARRAREARQHRHPVPTSPMQDETVRRVIDLLGRGLDRDTTARALARLLGVDVEAARLALQLADHGGIAKRAGGTTTSRPRASTEQGREQGREELGYRAGYVISAARRLNGFDSPSDGLARERRYYDMHVRARRVRMEAAKDQDQLAVQEGPWLGWYAAMTDRTTPECRAAHGHNYRANRAPRIGRPGTLHGGTCRCRSGPPWPTTRTVDQATAHLL